MVEIRKEISKILGNIHLPANVHAIVKESYADYEKAYKKLIQALKEKYPNKEMQILKIENETLNDYKEDMQMTELLEFEEYEQRRIVIIEAINFILRDIKENKNLTITKFDNKIKNTISEQENKKITDIVIDNMISEIESSGKYVLNKINGLELQDKEYLNMIKQQFNEEIDNIKQRAILKKPEMSKKLTNHYEFIYEQLDNIIEEYKDRVNLKEISTRNENSSKTKEEFDEER